MCGCLFIVSLLEFYILPLSLSFTHTLLFVSFYLSLFFTSFYILFIYIFILSEVFYEDGRADFDIACVGS